MAFLRLPKVVVMIVAILVTVGVAYILGVSAAGLVQKARARKSQAERTESILKQMGSNLAVGVTLPDSELEDLAGNPVCLSEITHEKSLVTFISPDCGACKIQLERFQKNIPSPAAQSHFILISDADPAELISLRDEYSLSCIFLHDLKGIYKSKLGVFTFPFNLVVTKALVIDNIISGVPEPDELEQIIQFNRQS
jgi:peroxiredoxin